MSIMREIPAAYLQPCEHPGTLEKVPYGDKYSLVYRPQGETDRIMYLIHGGGGNQETFFRPAFKNLVDHMIDSGELEPLLIVCPTYYDDTDTDRSPGRSGVAVKRFIPEFREQVIPSAERYLGLKPDRMHRAVGGFSMGGVTTWYAFMEMLDLFYWYVPMSGDCWALGEKGGGDHPQETAGLMVKAAKEQGGLPFRIRAVTGTKDIAFPNLDPQIKAMQAHPEVFGESMTYQTLEGGVHDYETIFRYLYNILPELFR